jgi:Flp pilus assembly protein TadG
MVEKKATRQHRNKAMRRRRGIVAVEFALVGSLLFMILIGLIDYGWIFLKAQQLTLAARHGARAAALADSTIDTVNAAIDVVLTDAGIALGSVARNIGATIVDPGTAIRVELTVPTSGLTLINTNLVPMPPELKAAASMAKEGT